jgi:hypothetical protein
MLVYNVDQFKLNEALDATNRKFGGNIDFKEVDYKCHSVGGGWTCKVTLKVIDSNQPGSRRSEIGRRIAAACWHVYGTFFDNLPYGTKIRTDHIFHAGDDWKDRQIGSIMRPLMHSEACNCAEWFDFRRMPRHEGRRV